MKILKKISLIVILNLSFFIHSIFDEKVYYGTYEIEGKIVKFKEFNINLLMISILSVIVSSIFVISNSAHKKLFSYKDKIILGSLYSIGKICNENSMGYVDFITKTIAKSVKSLSSKKSLLN